MHMENVSTKGGYLILKSESKERNRRNEESSTLLQLYGRRLSDVPLSSHSPISTIHSFWAQKIICNGHFNLYLFFVQISSPLCYKKSPLIQKGIYIYIALIFLDQYVMRQIVWGWIPMNPGKISWNFFALSFFPCNLFHQNSRLISSLTEKSKLGKSGFQF